MEADTRVAELHILLARAGSRAEYLEVVNRAQAIEDSAALTESQLSQLRVARATALALLSRPSAGLELMERELESRTPERQNAIISVLASRIGAFATESERLPVLMSYATDPSVIASFALALQSTELLDAEGQLFNEACDRFFGAVEEPVPDEVSAVLDRIRAFDSERRALNRAVTTGSFPPEDEFTFSYWRERIPSFRKMASTLAGG